jgi:hypothetical protein
LQPFALNLTLVAESIKQIEAFRFDSNKLTRFKSFTLMTMKFQNFLFTAVAVMLLAFVACKKTTIVNDAAIDAATDNAIVSVQDRGGLGDGGCYTLNFPVSISLPDASVVEVASYDDLKAAVKAWYTANGAGSHGKRFEFVYPVTVTNAAGEIITVNSREDFLQLRKDCINQGGNPGGGHTGGGNPGGGHTGGGGHSGGGNHHCYDINYPITIAFPDGTTQSVANGQEQKDAIKAWRQANPNATGRPTIQFPITVTMAADSTVVTVESADALKQLRKDCK